MPASTAARSRCSSRRRTAVASKTTSKISPRSSILPSRTRLSRFSVACESDTISVSSRKPATPLMVWNTRNRAWTLSAFGPSRSMASSSSSARASPSPLSPRKSPISSTVSRSRCAEAAAGAAAAVRSGPSSARSAFSRASASPTLPLLRRARASTSPSAASGPGRAPALRARSRHRPSSRTDRASFASASTTAADNAARRSAAVGPAAMSCLLLFAGLVWVSAYPARTARGPHILGPFLQSPCPALPFRCALVSLLAPLGGRRSLARQVSRAWGVRHSGRSGHPGVPTPSSSAPGATQAWSPPPRADPTGPGSARLGSRPHPLGGQRPCMAEARPARAHRAGSRSLHPRCLPPYRPPRRWPPSCPG